MARRPEDQHQSRRKVGAKTTISAIGWTWTAFGALAIFCAIWGLVMRAVIHMPDSPPPWSTQAFQFLDTNFRTIGMIQIAGGAFAAVSGVMLRRRKIWALFSIASLCIVLATLTIWFGVHWSREVLHLFSRSDTAGASLSVGEFGPLFAAGGSIVMVAIAGAFLFCLWCLCRAQVVSEFRKRANGV